jgi:hypothetical protein
VLGRTSETQESNVYPTGADTSNIDEGSTGSGIFRMKSIEASSVSISLVENLRKANEILRRDDHSRTTTGTSPAV